MKILANDGLDAAGINALQEKGLEVITQKVPQGQLADFINDNDVKILLVRSATQVQKDLIDACPGLQIIGRGGVGMDNIDVDYAREKGIHVINTPAASSESVAELVFAHLFAGVRFLHQSNRMMPEVGAINFADLKKEFAEGIELRGKTIGIIGMGRIGQEVTRIALGLGMKVVAADTQVDKTTIRMDFPNSQFINVDIKTEPLEEVLKISDFVTLHVPALNSGYLIGEAEISKMKPGAALVNCSRGGIIDENALVQALDAGKLRFAGLDVFENEPQPSERILKHPKISLTPHTGASTVEAQDRIGLSLAAQIFSLLQIN